MNSAASELRLSRSFPASQVERREGNKHKKKHSRVKEGLRKAPGNFIGGVGKVIKGSAGAAFHLACGAPMLVAGPILFGITAITGGDVDDAFSFCATLYLEPTAQHLGNVTAGVCQIGSLGLAGKSEKSAFHLSPTLGKSNAKFDAHYQAVFGECGPCPAPNHNAFHRFRLSPERQAVRNNLDTHIQSFDAEHREMTIERIRDVLVAKKADGVPVFRTASKLNKYFGSKEVQLLVREAIDQSRYERPHMRFSIQTDLDAQTPLSRVSTQIVISYLAPTRFAGAY
ncbi:MAG: hypothetical protein ACI9BD_000103 [Candidatus Marinamargulisbacteria bacterium]|jgi:hypothetical protein